MAMKIDGIVHAVIFSRRQSGSSQQGSVALTGARVYFRPRGINLGHIHVLGGAIVGRSLGS